VTSPRPLGVILRVCASSAPRKPRHVFPCLFPSSRIARFVTSRVRSAPARFCTTPSGRVHQGRSDQSANAFQKLGASALQRVASALQRVCFRPVKRTRFCWQQGWQRDFSTNSNMTLWTLIASSAGFKSTVTPSSGGLSLEPPSSTFVKPMYSLCRSPRRSARLSTPPRSAPPCACMLCTVAH